EEPQRGLAARGVVPLGAFGQRLSPLHWLQLAAGGVGVAQERPAQAIVSFDPLTVEAADVAHPVAVHRRVVARRDAREARALRPLRRRLPPRRRGCALSRDGAG